MLTFSPPVLAHRGASGYAPENTFAAFVKAAQLGIKWVEFDVMLSADNELILFHDATLERTTNGRGQVADYPYAYLKGLDAGRWFDSAFASEQIPTLQKVLSFLQEMKMAANIEIKPLPGTEEKLIRRLLAGTAHFDLNNILFSSFSVDVLTILRQQTADHALGLLLLDYQPECLTIGKQLSCTAIGMLQKNLTESIAHEIKQHLYTLLAFTVNDKPRAQQLFSWGVDAVFSDVPDKII